MAPAHPEWPYRLVSLNASYHKEQEYIWFMGGDLIGFSDIRPFMKWRGGAWLLCTGGPLGWSHWMCLIIRNKNIYGIGVRIWTVSEILGLLWSGGGGAPWGVGGGWGGGGALWHPPAKLLINSYHIPQISEKSVTWLLRTRPNKIWVYFRIPLRGRSGSAVMNFETLLHNFISISITSQNFRTICQVVTENSSGQNFGEIIIIIRNAVKPISLPTSFGRLNYNQVSSIHCLRNGRYFKWAWSIDQKWSPCPSRVQTIWSLHL